MTSTSSQKCFICGSSPIQMNNIDQVKTYDVNENTFKFGLSTLHAWIRFFECLLKNLKDETAAGIDKVTVKLIKYIESIIIGPLTYLYNLSIEKCTFPEIFKIAVVTPLYKIIHTCIINV